MSGNNRKHIVDAILDTKLSAALVHSGAEGVYNGRITCVLYSEFIDERCLLRKFNGKEITSCVCTNDCYKLCKYPLLLIIILNIQSQFDMPGMQSIGIVTYRHGAGRWLIC